VRDSEMVACLRQCLANARRWDGTGYGEGGKGKGWEFDMVWHLRVMR
jgi:hypothetical protein